MRKTIAFLACIAVLVVVAVGGAAGCTGLVGDFDLGNTSADGSVDTGLLDAGGDHAAPTDAPRDTFVAPPSDGGEGGPPCGAAGELCCGGTACNSGLYCSNQVCTACGCTGKMCGDNGCGTSCGTCPGTQACSPNGICNCMGSCTGKTCGDNGCGVSCGSCQTNQICSSAGACTACGATGQVCCTGMICNSPDTCSTATQTCVCNKLTCAQANAACGAPSDGCGGSLTCGGCTGGQTCGSNFQCACPAGQTLCNGACVNTQTDNGNCGGCGLTCSANPGCSAGECLLAIATNIPNVTGIAINAIKAYVTSYQTAGDIYAISLSGGGGIDLTPSFHQNDPLGIVVDAQYVYWTDFNGGTVMRMPLGGQVAPTTVASGETFPAGMAIDANNIYWTTDGDPGAVRKATISGLTVSTLVPGINEPFGIAVDSTYVYVAVTSDDYVIKANLSNGAIAAQLTNFQNNPYALAIDGTNVYFSNNANNGDVRQVAQNASMAAGTVLGTSVAPPGGVATDGTNVYWVGNNNLYKCPVGVANGCKVIESNQNGASFVVVDATSVYWTNTGAGTVMKLTPK